MFIIYFISCKEERIESIPSAEQKPVLTSENEVETRLSQKDWTYPTYASLEQDSEFLDIIEKLDFSFDSVLTMVDGNQLDLTSISRCEDVGYISYTFPLVSSSTSNQGLVKNLLFERSNGNYFSKIIEYTIESDDLYSLMNSELSSPLFIPINVVPIAENLYTVQTRSCWSVEIIVVIPCPCQQHTNPVFCQCGTQPIVFNYTYIECDDNTGGGSNDDGGVTIHPFGDNNTGIGLGGGNAGGGNGNDETNAGTELLLPLDEWYQIRLNQLITNFEFDISVDDLEAIVPISCMGEGNSFYSEFEECALEHMGLAGQDYFYDGDYWDDPNLTFPSQNLPSYQDFFDGFPKNPDGTWMYGADNIYNLVGGDVLQVRQTYPTITNNTCALKVSIALIEAGIVIPNIPLSTVEGADGNFYFLRAEILANWMKLTFPNFIEYTNEDYSNPNNPGEIISVNNLLGESKGIIISVYGVGPSQTSGHADIYTGENCSISSTGECDLGGTVFFWQLN